MIDLYSVQNFSRNCDKYHDSQKKKHPTLTTRVAPVRLSWKVVSQSTEHQMAPAERYSLQLHQVAAVAAIAEVLIIQAHPLRSGYTGPLWGGVAMGTLPVEQTPRLFGLVWFGFPLADFRQSSFESALFWPTEPEGGGCRK